MNACRRVAKNRHQECVGGRRAWEFHAVGELVWRDALQEQLAGVGVLALVALQWQAKQANSSAGHGHQRRAE